MTEQTQLKVQVQSMDFYLRILPSMDRTKISLASDDGKWKLTIPADSFAFLVPGETTLIHFGATRIAVEPIDAPDGLVNVTPPKLII